MFIAHPVPTAVQDQLQAQLAPYRHQHRGVRWTDPGSWHLTLLFLGTVDPQRLAALRTLVDRRAADHAPYGVSLEHAGGRVRRREGVAWLGVSEGASTLIEIASELAGACPADITDGPPPKRTPSAHLTLARRADDVVVKALRERSLGPLRIEWFVDRISLVRSHLEPSGATYETLHEATM